MRRLFYFLGMLLCLFFISSCAALGIGLTVGAFGIEAYEEARIHRPDLKLKPIQSHIESVQKYIRLPNLKLFSNQSSEENNAKTSASNAQAEFGFECSKLGDKEKQSKCFNEFSKLLAQQEEEYNKQKAVVTSRKKENSTKPQKVSKALKTFSSKVVKNPSQGNTTKTKKSDSSESLPSSYIENWVSTWEKQDIASYTSFYSKEFKGSKNHRGAWEASRQRAFKNNKNISIKLSNIQTYQKRKNKVAVSFTQEYKSDRYTDTGTKELTIENKRAGWKIIKETWAIEGTLANDKNSTDHSKQVTANLAGWLKAWEHQDVSTYLSFYSNKFKTPKGNRAKWRNARHRALKTNKNLSIQLSNIQTSQNKNIIELNFIQRFNSKKYSDVGIKELVWIKTGGDWKILKETWMSS